MLREGMIPCFVPRELALEILNVGKALNFIRLCCGDNEWTLRLGAPLRKRRVTENGGAGERKEDRFSSSSLARLEYGREAELQSVVRKAAALANEHLLELLMGKFELRAHCSNLQQFLLLGKGDFVQSLMEHLAPQLARPANQLHRHHLLSLVETAVRSSAPAPGMAGETGGGSASGGVSIGWIGGGGVPIGPGGESEQHALLLRHLDVTLTKTPGGSGWDAFCLDYNTGSPCDVIFSEGAMRMYRQASTFLWRLKRVEYTLTAVWRKHCTTARLIPKLHKDATMHAAYLLRNEMVHFVYNLQYYLMFEVIECAYNALDQKLSDASDLEDMLSAHTTFLADIERKAMLRREDEGIFLALKALFDSILQFARSQDVLYMSLLEQKAAHKAHAATVGASAAQGKWGATGAVSAAELGAVAVEPRLAEQLAAAADDYRSKFTTFFSLMRRHASYDLALFVFRLDFNEYYEAAASAADGGGQSSPQVSPAAGA